MTQIVSIARALQTVAVETPQGETYEGKKHVYSNVCGVSIVRAGECLEPALIEVYKDAKIGKILIQTNPQTGEPEVSSIMSGSPLTQLTPIASLSSIASRYRRCLRSHS